MHHGDVGEAAVRNWLIAFLPKRYGVTAGYVRSQGVPDSFQSSHFDVIVYDQLEAPTLWTEENRDKSQAGRARIIPAEHVGAIIEVKSAFHRRSVGDAAAKLRELTPLMTAEDAVGERYPRFLPATAVLAMLFFELRAADRNDVAALDQFREISFNRPFYGGVILRGEGLGQDDTGIVGPAISDEPMEPLITERGLLWGTSLAGTIQKDSQLLTAILMWSDTNFARFAFDLVALLKGTYIHGRVSSFHGLDFGAMMKDAGRS